MKNVQELAVASACEIMKIGTGCVMDTETTGIGPNDRIVSIAIIDFEGNVLLNTLVNPEIPIPDGARNVHGISNEKVADAPTWPELHEEVKQVLFDHQPVVIYNKAFDVRLLEQTSSAYGLSMLRKVQGSRVAQEYRSVCAMLLFANFRAIYNPRRGGYKWHKLVDAASYCGLKAEDTHDALGDVRMTLGVMNAMATSISPSSSGFQLCGEA